MKIKAEKQFCLRCGRVLPEDWIGDFCFVCDDTVAVYNAELYAEKK
jgi:hypothetical protein